MAKKKNVPPMPSGMDPSQMEPAMGAKIMASKSDQTNELARKKAKLGSGARFKALSNQLAKQPGVTDPNALAAAIGRKKLGKKKFQALAAKGK